MSSSQDLSTPKKTPTRAKTPSITAKSAKKPTKPPGKSADQTELNRAYYEIHSARIKASAAARYKAQTEAERSEVRWRREAKPPTPQPGGKRHTNVRLVALANAYCDFSDLDEVIRTYTACAVMNELGMGDYHVDHTIPLISRLVCGLHVHTNLSVVSTRENARKGNWLWPQMWPLEWQTMDLLMSAP